MNKSENINELAKALCQAQAKMKGAVKDSANPFFKSKYSDLASVIEAIREPFAEVGLCFTQLPYETESGTVLETVLIHTSGQWISNTLKVDPVKNDPQGKGSALSYMRRYGLQAISGCPSIDDDGNLASGKVELKPAASVKKTEPVVEAKPWSNRKIPLNETKPMKQEELIDEPQW